MKITVFYVETDQVIEFDIDEGSTIEELKTLIEADFNVMMADQILVYNNTFVMNDKSTVGQLKVKDGDMILL